IEYSGEVGERRTLNIDLDNRLVVGPNKLELIGAVWPNSRGGLLLLSGTAIVINADYRWSGSSMHNIIHQTWTIDYQPEVIETNGHVPTVEPQCGFGGGTL